MMQNYKKNHKAYSENTQNIQNLISVGFIYKG